MTYIVLKVSSLETLLSFQIRIIIQLLRLFENPPILSKC